MEIFSLEMQKVERYLNLSSNQIKNTAVNMANATTPGYTLESAIWQQSSPILTARGSIGDGVIDTSTVSQRDLVLNKAIDMQTQAQAASEARLGQLQDLQATFASAVSTSSNGGSASSTTGISSALSGFFGSFQQLEASPSDPSLRQAVLSSANMLSSAFNTASSSLLQQQQSISGEVSSVINKANGLLQSLAGLNEQIQSQDPTADAGTLEDQRQEDLTNLSQLIGIQQITAGENGVTITTPGGDPLVEGSVATILSTGNNNGAVQIFDGATNLTSTIVAGGGQVGGLLQAGGQDIPSALLSLDTLAFNVGTQVNTINQQGTDLNGNPGGLVFNLPSVVTGSASNISVAISSPSLIAAAGSGAGITDGSTAIAMAALATSSIVGGATPSNYYSAFVGTLGSTVAELSSTNSAQQASITQLTNQQTAISGVSLDTEATALENMEQAYQAASKVFTIIDQLVSASINLGVETAVS
jgi:flagellar hook-associated protein 1 FlgK